MLHKSSKPNKVKCKNMLTGNEMISEKTEDQMAIEIDKFDFHKAHCIT